MIHQKSSGTVPLTEFAKKLYNCYLGAENISNGGDENAVERDSHQGVENAHDPAVVRGRGLVPVTYKQPSCGFIAIFFNIG
jgi:hypothetical protein